MSFQYEYLDQPHPEEELKPKFKRKTKAVKMEAPSGEAFPIDMGNIIKMNEQGTENTCKNTVVSTAPKPTVGKIPPNVNKKPVKPDVAQIFKRNPSATPIAIRSPKPTIAMPFNVNQPTVKPDVAQILNRNPSATSVVFRALKPPIGLPFNAIQKPGVHKIVKFDGITEPRPIKRGSDGNPKSADLHHKTVQNSTSTPVEKTTPRSHVPNDDLPLVFTNRVNLPHSPCAESTMAKAPQPVHRSGEKSIAASNASVQHENSNEIQEQLSMIFEKLLVIEQICSNNTKYHIAEKRVLDDVTADMQILRQEVNMNFGDNKKAKLRLPIRNQEQLEEVEANFALYEEDLRLIFKNFVAHTIYDLFRHVCEQILSNTDYYNWTGTKAFNSPDGRIPKNASGLKIFQLLLEVGVEKMQVHRENAVHEMVHALKAFHAATVARDKRRKV